MRGLPSGLLASVFFVCAVPAVYADPPVASYIFPAGGQRGATVKVRVGGLYLYERCPWELAGPGLTTSKLLQRTTTRWFEGPVLPLPDSQRSEDYPRDMAGEVRIARDAPVGLRRGRVWTSEGVHDGIAFLVGTLPEVVEQETEGDARPVEVKLPVTINGRIYPRQDIDIWSVRARKGQVVTCEVHAARLGSPLDSRLEVRGPDGMVVAENEDARGTDSFLQFTAPADGVYAVRIHDSNRLGGQAYVYRLTITTDPVATTLYPAGGKAGAKVRVIPGGLGVPTTPVEITLPAGRRGLIEQALPLAGAPAGRILLDVDDLPEVLEREPNNTDDAAGKVTLPAVLNGRIDRPGDVDVWRFTGRKGESIALNLRAQVFGSPVQGVIEIADAMGKRLRLLEPTATGEAGGVFPIPRDGDYLVRIRDRFHSRGGPAFVYRLRLAPPAPDFALELPANVITVLREKPLTLKLRIVRDDGFNAPITVSVTGLPAGVTAAPLNVRGAQAQVNLRLSATSDAAIGQHRIQIRGTATVAGATVTRTARAPTGPDEQAPEDTLLAVALPAPFKIVGAYDLRIAPRGSVFRKRYKIERNGYTGPLEVRLADRQNRHLQGVAGPMLTIPAGADSFEYPVTLPPWMETGRTSRTCLMAIGQVKVGDREHIVSYTSSAQNDQIIAVVETGRLALETGRDSLLAQPGGTADTPIQIRRGKGLTGPVRIEVLPPEYARDIAARPVTIAADQTTGTLTLTFGKTPGPPVCPVLVRATLDTPTGPVIAETTVEVVVAK